MYLRDNLRTLWRRWYVFFPILILGVTVSAFAYSVTPASYAGSASVVLLSPEKIPSPTAGQPATATNPYMRFDGSLYSTADVIARSLTGDDTLALLRERNDAATVSAGMAPGSSAPVIDIAVKASDPDTVIRTVKDMIKRTDVLLQDRQAIVTPDETEWIRSSVVTATERPVKSSRKPLQVAVLLFALSLGAAYGASFLIEGWAVRPQRRRSAPAHLADDDPGIPNHELVVVTKAS